jgi:hypothetical protein
LPVKKIRDIVNAIKQNNLLGLLLVMQAKPKSRNDETFMSSLRGLGFFICPKESVTKKMEGYYYE